MFLNICFLRRLLKRFHSGITFTCQKFRLKMLSRIIGHYKPCSIYTHINICPSHKWLTSAKCNMLQKVKPYSQTHISHGQPSIATLNPNHVLPLMGCVLLESPMMVTSSPNYDAIATTPSRSRIALKHREDDLHHGWKDSRYVCHTTCGESRSTFYVSCSTILGCLQSRMHNAQSRELQNTQTNWIWQCLSLPIIVLHTLSMYPLCSSSKWTFALR